MSRLGWREVREGILGGRGDCVARAVLAYLERCAAALPERRWRPFFTAVALGDPAPEELLAAAKRVLQDVGDTRGEMTLARFAEAVLADTGLRARLGEDGGSLSDGAPA